MGRQVAVQGSPSTEWPGPGRGRGTGPGFLFRSPSEVSEL